ncbi:unnamed protein product [Brassica oleracea var. botrytis]|uniref:Uncharacterized protein n=2 Tax=Brassica TaxID=3705 RepID=A0A3P6F8U9_BRAOL|nr:unnamed protein product [Brassica napus]CDY65575.1 BnaCnng47800D [Brassica napus]VDD48650.1 unnamed protein product [Brassica oleracea]
MATIIMDSAKVVVLDIRFPALPVVELQRHQASVNAIAWAPHSSLHICTAGDDSQALIWDISLMGQKNLPSPAQPPSESVEHAARAFCEHRYDKPEKKSVPLSHDRSHTEPWYLHGFSENEGSAYTMKQLILL